jgi:hypothetical protein
MPRLSRWLVSEYPRSLTAAAPRLDRPTRRLFRWAVAAGVAALLAVAITLGLAVLTSHLHGGQPGATSSTTPSRPPFTPRHPTDPRLSPAPQEERTVELIIGVPDWQTVHIDYWRGAADDSGDLRVDASRLYTAAGAGIALLPGTQPASYTRCAALPASAWTTEIPLGDLAPGAQLCGYSTGDRYAMLQVISVPSANNRRLIFFGRTWQVAAKQTFSPG